jgi:hypothetical protein
VYVDYFFFVVVAGLCAEAIYCFEFMVWVGLMMGFVGGVFLRVEVGAGAFCF